MIFLRMFKDPDVIGRVGLSGVDVSPALYLALKRETKRDPKKALYTDSQLDTGLKLYIDKHRQKLRAPHSKDIPDLERFAQNFVQQDAERNKEKPTHKRSKTEEQALQLLGLTPEQDDPSPEDHEEDGPDIAQLQDRLLDFIAKSEVSEALCAALIAKALGDRPGLSFTLGKAIAEKYHSGEDAKKKNLILDGVDVLTHETDKKELQPVFKNLRGAEKNPEMQYKLSTLLGQAEVEDETPRQAQFSGNGQSMMDKKRPPPQMAPKGPTAALFSFDTARDERA